MSNHSFYTKVISEYGNTFQTNKKNKKINLKSNKIIKNKNETL